MDETTPIQWGLLVQRISSGEQGFICRVYETIDMLPQVVEGEPRVSYEDWLAQENLSLLPGQTNDHRWYQCMNLGVGWHAFTACQSDLAIIEPAQINRNKYPFTYYAEIATVGRSNGEALKLTFEIHKDGWGNGATTMFIEHPTVTPCVGDTIYGHYDYAVINSGGIPFPYQRFAHKLTQDWPTNGYNKIDTTMIAVNT